MLASWSRPARALRLTGRFLAIGVVLLVLIGQGIFMVTLIKNENAAPPHVTTHGSALARRIETDLATALGSSDRGVRRFRLVSLGAAKSGHRLHEAVIRWSINNDMAEGTLGNGAQLDAYSAFRVLYSSGLPLANVRLIGTYPVPDSRGQRSETVVMRLSLSHRMAHTLTVDGWDNLDASAVWPLINRQYVARQFQPQSQEE
ncbi:MAG: hypothetical protein ACRDFS_04040 [Chloroflexota bacterium]